MKKKTKEKIAIANYGKLALLFLVVILLAFGIRQWYLNFIALEHQVPVIADVLTKQIRKEELYSFVNENDPAIIYFSVSDDEDCRTFEEEISSLIQDYSLEDIVVYMNLRGEDVARYLDTVAAYYHYDGSFEEVPTFLYFEDGEIKEVLTDTLKKEDVKTFFQTIGVIS